MYKATITGRLGADPEMREVQVEGQTKKVCSFNVAAENRGKQTQWFRVNTWEGQAEAAMQMLQKGSAVMVEGPITARAFVGKEDNKPRASMEVRAQAWEVLGNPKPKPEQSSGNSSGGKANPDDIPF